MCRVSELVDNGRYRTSGWHEAGAIREPIVIWNDREKNSEPTVSRQCQLRAGTGRAQRPVKVAISGTVPKTAIALYSQCEYLTTVVQ